MPEQEAKDPLYKYRPTLDFNKLLRFIVTHPGLAIFIVYGTIAIAGFIYLITFFRHFDLEVIVYLELADILTAGIKDPLVMLMVLGSFFIVFFVWFVTYIGAPFSAWLDKKFDKGFFRFLPHLLGVKSTKVFWQTALFLFIFYFIFSIYYHSDNKADRIKREKTNLIQVESDAIINDQHQYSLLGTSINYIFLYNHNEADTLILPLENVHSLKPIKKKKENN